MIHPVLNLIRPQKKWQRGTCFEEKGSLCFTVCQPDRVHSSSVSIPAYYPPRLQHVVDSGEIYGKDRLAFIRYVSDIMMGFNPNPSPSACGKISCWKISLPSRHHSVTACLGETLILTVLLICRAYSVFYTIVFYCYQTSLKLQLSQRIRNMRHYKKRSASESAKGMSNARSKAVEVANVTVQRDQYAVDMDNYRRNVAEIQKQWKSNNPDRKQVKTLMDVTFSLRRHWIRHEVRSVKVIVDTFPSLKSKGMVRMFLREYLD